MFKNCIFFAPQLADSYSAEQVNGALRNKLQDNPVEDLFTDRRQVTSDQNFVNRINETKRIELLRLSKRIKNN
ncbi:MAC/perforin domain protein, putative (macronuclear) [Tetrahymena thermophila SB210]|uniref:MAC/perforin domain protein, putative n=1 Tax=Tetrahymena thermophila (strain SB210) TaxID=312017 RepID=W7XA01_TETTS|nr:MAC/perforin domain protein, putative [Tetrahymena thermophila SB210]EWS74157.1 MAC/perforin domain protein, putative [Tetrahymena thermophila SB210]|eukprot:XP_012653297.1 MAC/perforin domain protein, putative [Tetrahymena thermophila SB210]